MEELIITGYVSYLRLYEKDKKIDITIVEKDGNEQTFNLEVSEDQYDMLLNPSFQSKDDHIYLKFSISDDKLKSLEKVNKEKDDEILFFR